MKEWIAISSEKEDGWHSVKLVCPRDGREYYMDAYVNPKTRDITCDWNQTIFGVYDETDQERKAIQEDPDEYEEASSAAISFLEKNALVYQTASGDWFDCSAD